MTTPLSGKDIFFKSGSLGTVVEPKCGSCKCSKCPVPGVRYSFKEQREYDVINNNLYRVKDLKRWFTKYPWHCNRNFLPKNDRIAYQSLMSLEKRLSLNPEWADAFCKQVEEMLERGAAVHLTEEELEKWKGDYHYLPMVLVKGKKRFRV